MEENIEQRVDLTLFSEKIQELKDQIASVIVGQEQTVDLVLAAILANGHVLIEGVPGVAKTLLARLTARFDRCGLQPYPVYAGPDAERRIGYHCVQYENQ